MNDHLHTALIRHRTYLGKEIYQIAAESLGIYAIVPCKSLPELVKGETFLAARKTCYHISRYQFYLRGIHLLITCLCLGYILLGIFTECSRPFQYEQIESHKRSPLEPESPGSIRHLIRKVSPRPVENRHEIVCHAIDAALGQIPE